MYVCQAKRCHHCQRRFNGCPTHPHLRLHPALRTRLVAEFRERWTRAGRPGQVQHILGNMSLAHGVPFSALKDIHARSAASTKNTLCRPTTQPHARSPLRRRWPLSMARTSPGHAPPTTVSRGWTI